MYGRSLSWPFPAILIVVLTALSLTAATVFFFPKSDESREVAIADLLHASSLPPPSLAYGPQAFCAEWTGLETLAVDCRYALQLQDLQSAQGPDKTIAWSHGVTYAEQLLSRFAMIAERLSAKSQSEISQSLLLVMQQKNEAWNARMAEIRTLNIATSGQQAYSQLFNLLLDLEGSSYDAGRDRFHRVNWHVARVADPEPAVLSRAQRLVQVLNVLPWFVGGLSLVLMCLGWWRCGWAGLILMASFCVIDWLGLLMAADASVHYGDHSFAFYLNPLGNQLARQFQVSWMGAGLICIVVLLVPRTEGCLRWPMRHLWLAMVLFVIAMVAAYALLGPAMGSEVLKVSVALMAGLLTAAHGRSIFLASQIAPQSLTIMRVVRPHKVDLTTTVDACDLIANRLGKPVVELALCAAVGLAMAALVFHDLGAALVTALIALCALYMVMGARLTAVVIVLMSVVAAAFGQSSKIQERIALMLDPMNASVSDFARLMAFAGASKEHGFALGHMPWCNSGGVCIPIQSLSDYMPIVLGGLWGFNASVAYFCVFILALIWMGREMMHHYLTRKGSARTLAITTLYLLVGVGAQTVITFLGNWRIIPLTGIGAPLLSIGLSSSLAPCLALGLFLTVKSWPKDEPVEGL